MHRFLILVFLGMVLGASTTYAQKTWTGSLSTDWGTAGNWSPSGVPSSGQNVSIPNTTNKPTVNGAYAINNLIISSSWGGGEVRMESGTLTVNGAITLNGQGILQVNGGELLHQGTSFSFAFGSYNAVRITGGLLRTNATNFVINSGMVMSGGLFEANAGLAVASGRSFTATGGVVRVMGHLNIQSSNSSFYAGDSLLVNGRVTLSGSTSFYGGSAVIVVNRQAGQNNQLSGDWFTQQAHIVFNPSTPMGNNLTSISSGGAQFRVGQGTVVFNDSIFVGSNATLFADSGTVTIAKNLQVSGSGVVSNETGTINFQSGALFTNNGTLNAGTGQLNFAGNVVVNNSAGTINADASTIVISGNLATPGNFNAGTSTVVLNGDSDQTISNDIVFYNLDIQTAGSLLANGNIVVLNDGIIGDSTTIELGGNQLNVQGDLTDNGGNLAVATDKPFVVAASAVTSTSVVVEFNEALNATANNAANYSLSPGLSVTAASVNGKLVTLTVNPAMTEREYTLTVKNVRNLNNTAINANHIKRFVFSLINAPTQQSSNFSVSSATATSLTLVWTRGNGSSVLVVAREANVPVDPVTGIGYVANAQWQAGSLLGDSSYAVYAGSGTEVTVTGLLPGSLYVFKIFEQNGSNSTAAYLISESSTVARRFTLPLNLTEEVEVAGVTDSSIAFVFNRGEGDGVLLLARKGAAVGVVPVSGQNYNANNLFGAGDDLGDNTYVLAQTQASEIVVEGLMPNTVYHFAWFDYSGEAQTRSYVPEAATTASQHTFLKLQLRLFLEGPFVPEGDSMRDALTALLPTQQPFNRAPWQYAGDEVLQAVPPNGIVDWVLVQLRQSDAAVNATTDKVVFERACLLHADGWVMDTAGDTAFLAAISRAGAQYVVVFPRSHLPAFAADSLFFNGNAFLYDFGGTQNGVIGASSLKQLGVNKWVLVAGFLGETQNFEIGANDILQVWQSRNATNVYRRADVNHDGLIDASDRSLVWNNRGRSSTFPID